MNSCIYEGRVEHRRYAPQPHTFGYRMFMFYLDLAELPEVFANRRLWGVDRPALACFKRGDHYGDPARPLDDDIRDLVARRSGRRPTGPIRLLTHLRYFGRCFNPVSFYYCFDSRERHVQSIVAEVNNTPWGEQYCYVLSVDDNLGTPRHQRYELRKRFHVSPFMPMGIDYDWRFTEPGEILGVHMRNHTEAGRVFDATLALRRTPINSVTLGRVLATYPPMTARVIVGIYWQALRLWLKKTPFHGHPRSEAPPAARTP